MKNTSELLKLCNELIEALESNYTQAELLGECPMKDLYLEARKARYNLKNAPEAFQ
jgi:hypothetical protein